MKTIIICCIFISNSLLAQDYKKAEQLIDKVYNRLMQVEGGSSIQFDYFFENDSYQMKTPIAGTLSLFSDNRFYLEFNNHDNNMIQIYNGENLKTILLDEKEIQVDNIDDSKGLFIQNIFNNYKTDFISTIKEENNRMSLIELLPQKKYNQNIFNECIEKLELPECLKLPNQCKIGITPKMKEHLNDCLNDNKGYEENEILKVQIQVNPHTLDMESIKQINRYSGQTIINIKEINSASPDILNIDGLYKDFEIIDLR